MIDTNTQQQMSYNTPDGKPPDHRQLLIDLVAQAHGPQAAIVTESALKNQDQQIKDAMLNHNKTTTDILGSQGIDLNKLGGLNQNPKFLEPKGITTSASITPEGDIQQSGMFGSVSTDYLLKRLLKASEINRNMASTNYMKNGGSNQKVEGIENLTPEQQLQVWDMSKKYGGVRGATRVAPSIIAQMNAGVPIDQIEDKLRYSQQSSSISDEWRGAAQSILSKSSPSQTNKQMDALDDYVQRGDTEGGKNYLKRISLEQAPVEQKQMIMGKERTVDLLDNIGKDLNTLKKNGEDTGFVSGNLEDIYSRVGKVKNPEMRKIATKIASALITYRRSMTGAAFSQLESDEYKKIFPSINKAGDFNDVNIKALKEVFSGDTNKFYEQSMGPSNYNKLFNSNVTSTSSSSPNNLKSKYGLE